MLKRKRITKQIKARFGDDVEILHDKDLENIPKHGWFDRLLCKHDYRLQFNVFYPSLQHLGSGHSSYYVCVRCGNDKHNAPVDPG